MPTFKTEIDSQNPNRPLRTPPGFETENVEPGGESTIHLSDLASHVEYRRQKSAAAANIDDGRSPNRSGGDRKLKEVTGEDAVGRSWGAEIGYKTGMGGRRCARFRYLVSMPSLRIGFLSLIVGWWNLAHSH